eukprot:386516-Prymnesium_polylepis.1
MAAIMRDRAWRVSGLLRGRCALRTWSARVRMARARRRLLDRSARLARAVLPQPRRALLRWCAYRMSRRTRRALVRHLRARSLRLLLRDGLAAWARACVRHRMVSVRHTLVHADAEHAAQQARLVAARAENTELRTALADASQYRQSVTPLEAQAWLRLPRPLSRAASLAHADTPPTRPLFHGVALPFAPSGACAARRAGRSRGDQPRA